MSCCRNRRHFLSIIMLFLIIGLLLLSSCLTTQAGPVSYDSGPNNLTLTGSQITQYNLIRFDTSAAERTLTLPGAADIVDAFSVPAGSFTALVVTSDGGHGVKVVGGSNVTVKLSAATVAANTTQTLFLILNDVSSGTEAVTVH